MYMILRPVGSKIVLANDITIIVYNMVVLEIVILNILKKLSIMKKPLLGFIIAIIFQW